MIERGVRENTNEVLPLDESICIPINPNPIDGNISNTSVTDFQNLKTSFLFDELVLFLVERTDQISAFNTHYTIPSVATPDCVLYSTLLESKCVRCKKGFELTKDYTCFSGAPCPDDTQFLSTTGQCQPCRKLIDGCARCELVPLRCFECLPEPKTEVVDSESVRCVPKKEIKVLSRSFNNAVNRVEIRFSKSLKNRDFNKELDDSSIEFKLEDSHGIAVTGYSVKGIERHSQEKDTLIINLSFNEGREIKDSVGIFKQKLKLNSSENSIVSESGETPYQGEKIEVDGIYFYYSEIESLAKAGGQILAGTASTVIVVATLINLPLAVYLMKLFQYTSFLTLINIEWPKNV